MTLTPGLWGGHPRFHAGAIEPAWDLLNWRASHLCFPVSPTKFTNPVILLLIHVFFNSLINPLVKPPKLLPRAGSCSAWFAGSVPASASEAQHPGSPWVPGVSGRSGRRPSGEKLLTFAGEERGLRGHGGSFQTSEGLSGVREKELVRVAAGGGGRVTECRLRSERVEGGLSAFQGPFL